jgi:glycosyltransferase involved in cell wall biosynthesis
MSGGGPRRNFEIYRRLSHKHEITVLTPTFEGSTQELIRDNVRYIRLGRKIRNHGSSHHITFFFSLPRAIRQFDYDLLVEDFMPPASATLNPLFSKAPTIASVQWFFAEALSRQYKLPFFIGERYGVKLYKHFIVLTESMRNTIKQRNSRADSVVIPNGVDNLFFECDTKFDDYILFVGRVDINQKGVDLMLRAYAKIPKGQRIPLILVGHSFQEPQIIALASSLGIENDISMVGKVAGKKLYTLVSGCRFVCVPSREETFGMVITEACAAGKNVVLFDKAPMNEVASSRCIKVPPFDVAKYSAGMLELLVRTSDDLYADSKVNKLWASQYSWDKIAIQQDNYYQSVIKKSQIL